MRTEKPTITLCMIVKDEEAYLPRCLDSVKDYINYCVIVDTGSTDKTKEIAKKYTDLIYDFEWCDDFSAARNFSFEKVPDDTDWILWLDADDIVEGGENLVSMAASAPHQIEAIVFHYYYEKHESGNWINVHNRERLLRKAGRRPEAKPWTWLNRVHECIDLGDIQPGGLAMSEDVHFYHMRPVGKPCFTRNVRLLKKQIKDEPHNLRPYAYVGHEYYHVQDWKNALKWYQKYINMGSTWYAEVYQILHRMGDCCIQLHQFDKAKKLNLEALGIKPEWADAYLGLMEVEAWLQNWDKCVEWYEAGAQKEPIDPALAMNPLDYTYNAWLFYEAALFNTGKVKEALVCVEDSLTLIGKNPILQQKKEMYSTWLLRDGQAKAMITLCDSFTEEEQLLLLSATPHYLKANTELRDKLVLPHYKRRPIRDTIVFFCGRSVEPWAPPKMNEGGIGGSETAVVEIAKRLVKKGYPVNVYNNCGHWEGEHEGVWYWEWDRFNPSEMPLLFIAERWPDLIDAIPNGLLKICHLHDLHYGDRLSREIGMKWNKICPVSEWHGKHLQLVYQIPDEKIMPIPNGIDLTRFTQAVKRNPKKCVYSSSPDRGLEPLVFNIWPKIVEAVPDAELHIFYGWDSFLASASLVDPNAAAGMHGFKDLMMRKVDSMPSVHWRGRVGQAELTKEFLGSGFWLYPTDFLEVSCITAMEAQAAGLAIIATDLGALKETVADRGYLIPGFSRNYSYQKMFLGTVFALMDDENKRQEIAKKGLDYAHNFSWDGVVDNLADWMETELKKL